MVSRIEPLYKAPNKIDFGWFKESGDVEYYNVYVGQNSGSLSKLESNIPNTASELGRFLGKIAYTAAISSVRNILSLSLEKDFSNTILYWAITTVDSAGSESSISDSIVVTVYPTGIDPKLKKDDHTIDRLIYGFSDSQMRWTKLSASSDGALITDSGSGFYSANMITEYSYDGTNLKTERIYPSDQTSSGSPAKLITYEYSGGMLTKKTVTDSTVL